MQGRGERIQKKGVYLEMKTTGYSCYYLRRKCKKNCTIDVEHYCSILNVFIDPMSCAKSCVYFARLNKSTNAKKRELEVELL